MSGETIKSVRRVFEIIEYFDEVQRPLSLQQVSTRFGYATSSAAAMLKSMMLLGYLNYDPVSRSYMPTIRLANVGTWVQTALLQQDVMVDAVKRLCDRTGESISISSLCDIYMQYLYVVYPDQLLHYRVPAGTLRPVTGSGSGWMLLSVMNDDAIERLWRRGNRVTGARRSSVTLKTVMDRVGEARTQGYVVSRNTSTQGVSLIAMAIPEQFFGRPLVLGVSGPGFRIEEKFTAILREMRATIAGLGKVQRR